MYLSRIQIALQRVGISIHKLKLEHQRKHRGDRSVSLASPCIFRSTDLESPSPHNTLPHSGTLIREKEVIGEADFFALTRSLSCFLSPNKMSRRPRSVYFKRDRKSCCGKRRQPNFPEIRNHNAGIVPTEFVNVPTVISSMPVPIAKSLV